LRELVEYWRSRIAVEGKMFSVRQIVLATFLGAPLAGCFLLAQNYRVIGRSRGVALTLVAGVASTILLLLLVLVLPDSFPNMVLPIASVIALRQVAVSLQGETISQFLIDGGPRCSWWLVVGIGIACLIVVFCLAFLLVMGINSSLAP